MMKFISIALITLNALIGGGACAHQDIDAGQVDVSTKKFIEILPVFPGTNINLSKEQIVDTVNVLDVPDALKYAPSLMIRKRDSADFSGATLATRIWGISYSAKSIVNVDSIPISSQIYNDNNYGSPKWFMVSPEEIEGIDVMYGPYSAAYSGNSMGAVVHIHTKMPDQFTAVTSVTGALQAFNQFGTKDQYLTGQVSALVGSRENDFSWRLAIQHQEADTQPRSFVTGSSPVTPYPYSTKTGTNGGYYLGATGLLNGASNNFNLKMQYNLLPSLTVGFTTGLWAGDIKSGAQPYTNGFCIPTCTSYASGIYTSEQQHWMNAMTVKSHSGNFEWEAVLSNVYYDKNLQRTAGQLNPDGSINYSATNKGVVADFNGTGWTNADWRGKYQWSQSQVFSIGVHYDYNRLNSQTYKAQYWDVANVGTLTTLGRGVTQTQAVWFESATQLMDKLKVTGGLRYELWSSFDGVSYNSSSSTLGIVNQLDQKKTHLSPKLSFAYDLPQNWLLNYSMGNAMRFPTVGELYNIVSSTPMGSYFSPSPLNVRPENVWSTELSLENSGEFGFARATLFAEQVSDALISQYGYPDAANPTTLYQYWQNIKKVRSIGLELVGQTKNIFIRGFDLGASLTMVDSKIIENDGLGSNRQSIVGNPTPGVSPLKITSVATYRPDAQWSYSLAARYQRQFASSIDNNDVNANTYLGFSGFFVMDLRAKYQIDQNWRATFGIDNLNNRKYFLYHPFPQRTFVANLRYSYN